MQLSEVQKKAVEHIGTPALVCAGAGSGKTRTLVAKIQYLLEKGYQPERILAITFTNKAAQEMKTRLKQLTGLGLDRFQWVRTYHSACYKILKSHCHLLGYTPPIQIFAEYQQTKVLKDIIVVKLNFDKKYVNTVRAALSNAKNSGNPMGYFDTRPYVSHIKLINVFNLYQKELFSKNALDFDDILLLTRNLLRDHKEVREFYQNQFDYMLVDEYQDNNDLQAELSDLLLKNGNFFAVGDDWQSVYSFRMSNVDHFLSFKKKYPNAEIFNLEQNYRSTDEIVQLGNHLISNNEYRMEKTCFSEKQGGRIELQDFYDEREEADWVAGKINVLRNGGVPYEKMAVLYRTKFSSLAFEQKFRAAGIPYRLVGSKGFFDRKEILDLNCYLTAACFNQDDAAFERIINTPKRGIGPGILKKINALRTDEISLQQAARKALKEKIFTPKLYSSLNSLIDLLDSIRNMKPNKAIEKVIDTVGYMPYLEKYSAAQSSDFISKKENIEQLIFSASQKDNIVDYLEEAALIKEDKEDDQDKQAGVNLMTVHAAKGLEFLAVWSIGLEEGLFPHSRSMDTEKDLEEERRLCYVSWTRAERYLFLSHADFRRGRYAQRSRFIDEVAEYLEE
ncbi:MAG: UvrD-helicase domain-containing protein [Desulfobacterales bacterium]|nr:UvrD-helicase domain-containing protein [Desulfobacterales bacterium]